MNKSLLLIAATMAFTAVQAQALELQQYVSVKGNYAKLDSNFTNKDPDGDGAYKAKTDDKTFGASLAYGVKISDFRTELEGNWNANAEDKFVDQDGDKTKTKVTAHSLMWNTYYDIPTGLPVRPYVGAGIGVARVKATLSWPDFNEKFSMKKTKFAYQLGAGVSYDLTSNWAIDAGYRYLDYGKFTKTDEDGKNTLKTKTHNVHLGVRYTF